MSVRQITENALELGRGVLRLAPTWVPRKFCIPGKRMKLHPDDYYVLGLERGGIDERWFASTIRAQNGPLTPEDEGLSYLVFEHEGELEKVTLQVAVDTFKSELIGERLWSEYERWPAYAKFFDNQGPLPFHIHQKPEHAALVNQFSKPEMYFFPEQLNNHGGTFPFTFFGLNQGTTKDQLRNCLEQFDKGDNKILDLSKAHKLVLGTGWDVPAGVLHAPGSLCTYEPQFASDIYAMYQSVLYGGETVPVESLWANCPEDKLGDFDYLVEIIDWEKNLDPDFVENRFMRPIEIQSDNSSYSEKWICYKSDIASAKELTIYPQETVTIKDAACYGFIAVQGFGSINNLAIETPTLIRYGQLTFDEYFVTEKAAREGVSISNYSKTEPLVLLKHFGPANPDLIQANL